jgi:hypothetical protein
MSIVGVKQRLLLEVIRLLFGPMAEKVASAIIDYSPCPLRLISDVTQLSLPDTKTVALSMYIHGVISLIQDGPTQSLSLNSLPVFILSCPSLLLDQIHSFYSSPHFVTSFQNVLFHGIIEDVPPRSKSSDNPFERLLTDGLLMRRIVDFSTFSTDDVFSVERKSANAVRLSELRRRKEIPKSGIDPVSGQKVIAAVGATQTLTVDWNGVATFLRSRYVLQSTQSILGSTFVPLLQAILTLTKASDYSGFRGGFPADSPVFQSLDLMTVYSCESDLLFNQLDIICASQISILKSGTGLAWQVTVPQAIRSLQIQYLEMFTEQSLSPYHRRCFNHLRSLSVGDTHQIEIGALLSEKDARSSMYGLCRLGIVQMQSIPRNSGDRMIGPRTIFVWRYDENAAIEAYRTMIGEHARKVLARLNVLNEELERSEGAEVTSKTAAKLQERKEKQLVALNACYVDALRVFILFAEM